MEKVLLAVEGSRPTQKVLKYSLELCKRIRAGLDILHIIRDSRLLVIIDKQHRKMKQIGKYLEATQVAAAFAEVDEHDTARQVISQAIDDMTVITRQSADEGVACHLSYGTGSTEKEISWFVDNHPDVILAICDTSGQKTGSSIDRSFDKIKQHLCVPVVKFDGRPSGKTAKPVL